MASWVLFMAINVRPSFFCNKLSFLIRVCNGETTSLGTQLFRNIAVSDVTSMSIIKQSYFLDSILETEFTDNVLNNPELCIRDLKKRVIVADCLKIVQSSKRHPSLSLILHIAEENLLNSRMLH